MLRFTNLVGLILAAGLLFCGTASAIDLYYLGRVDQSNNFGMTTKVPNLTIRASWATVEPSNGTYNWTNVWNGINAAGSANISIVIQTGVFTPSWVGAQTVSGTFKGNPVVYPVPWDNNYLSALSGLITKAGRQFSSEAHLERAIIPALCTQTYETYLDQSGISLSTWQNVGYSKTNVENTFKNNINAVRTAFPSIPIANAWLPGKAGLNFDTQNGTAIIGDIETWFAGQTNVVNMNLGANATWVMAFTAPPAFAYQSSGPLGTPGINNSITLATNAGANAYEVYPPDVQYVN